MKKGFKTTPPAGPKNDFEGYPIYPASEDIYSQSINENDLDPEFLSRKKTPNETSDLRNELDFSEDLSGEDLDVPGSEFDDAQEEIGSEDEENNYYSIGGDAHTDLDENDGSI
jgi:hypothetical protein